MKTILRLECIGDGHRGRLSPSPCWVAEIVAVSPYSGLDRRFLHRNKDYSEANSVGSRGVYAYYILESGKIYEVSEPLTWKKTDRYLCTVTPDGEIEKLDMETVMRHFLSLNPLPSPAQAKEELEACLRSRSELASLKPHANA